MSCETTSLSDVFQQGNRERHTDCLYSLLVDSTNQLRTQLVNGLHLFITSKTQHPAVDDMFGSTVHSTLVEKAILLAAISREPDFLQHLMEREDTCNSCLSQFCVQILPSLLEQFLNGEITLDVFVLKATHEYILL